MPTNSCISYTDLKSNACSTDHKMSGDPHIDVEYCNKCGYSEKFHDLLKFINEKHPSVEVNGHEGRRGSFEVSINGQMVHSKLSTLAYPDYDDLGKLINEVKDGKPGRTCKQQPITGCTIT